MVWLAGAVAVAILLRAPWLGVPLGNDEGGLAYIAAAGHGSGPFLYGDFFIDRPPLLLAVFWLATETGGTAAGTATVRAIGALVAVATVATTAVLARDMAGERAARVAAAMTAVLVSSIALESVFTPAELLAILPSAVSVLLVWRGAGGDEARPGPLVAAGALAVCALLVKQSAGDALLAGSVCLAAAARWRRWSRRDVAVAVGAYALGVAAVAIAMGIWTATTAARDGAALYALLGFRLEGFVELTGPSSGVVGRFAERLLAPLIVSGLAVVLVWAVAGLRRARRDRVLVATLGAWGVGGALGVLGGGSYWGHYLIQLIPFAAVSASIALAGTRPRRRVATAAVLGVCAIGGVAVGPVVATNEKAASATIGRAVAAFAEAGDTIHVLYSQPNVLYYSDLPAPYPYHWSLMMRTVPRAQVRLRALLSSPRRPTWVVVWDSPRAYGLDQSGKTSRRLRWHYRHVSTACGAKVLVRRGAQRSFEPPPRRACEGSTPW